MVVNPEHLHTQTITGRYTTVMGMTENEVFLSEERYRRFSEIEERHIRKVGDKGPPTKTQRFRATTELTRAERMPPFGRLRVGDQYGDFLQTAEDFETREKRYSRQRLKGRSIILGGAAVKYGVPVLVYGSIAYGIGEGVYYHEGGLMDSNRLHEAIGPLALPVTIAVDTAELIMDIGDLQREFLSG